MNHETNNLNGWRTLSLSEICKNKPQNGAFVQNPILGSGTPFVNVYDTYQGEIVNLDEVERVECNETFLERYGLNEEDLLFVRSSLKREGIGQCCVIRGLREKAIFDCHLIKISPITEKVDSLFLVYFFSSNAGKQDLIAKSNTTTMTTINQKTLLNVSVLLPPLPEQKAIAKVLRSVQSAKEARQNELRLERERKNALMNYLFTHGTRGESLKQTEIGEMPESWEVKELGKISSITSGGTPSRENPNYWKGEISWVKTGEINYKIILDTEEKITEEGLHNSSARIIKKGTILMAMYGQGVTRGRVAILGIDAAINQACAAITVSEEHYPNFIFYYFVQIYEKLRSLGHGANQRNLNSALIKSVLVKLPPIEEQKEIAEILQACDEKISALEKEIKLHNEFFKAMLEELMNGNLPAVSLIEN